MDIRAIQDRIIVTPIFAELTSASGLYLGEGEMTGEGVVLAVGPGRRTKLNDAYIPTGISIGDTVVFGTGVGAQTTAGRAKILVLKESQILAIRT